MQSIKRTFSRTLLQLLILSIACVFALSVNYLYAAVWQGPPAGTPPANNVDSPINVGTTNQVKDANLSVGHSANTASDYGLISYGRLRTTIGGVEFPDGTVQTTAAGGGGSAPVYSGGQVAKSTTKNIGLNWDAVSIGDSTDNGSDNKGAASFVYREGGVVKAVTQILEYPGAAFTVSSTYQCAGGGASPGQQDFCIKLDSAGLWFWMGSNTSMSYMTVQGGGSPGPQGPQGPAGPASGTVLSFDSYAHFQNRITTGQSNVAGGWSAIVLNTDVVNSISGASRSGNQITLPAGTYYVDGTASAFSIGSGKNVFYNVTDATYPVVGMYMKPNGGSDDQGGGDAPFAGTFTISSSKVFELRMYATESGYCPYVAVPYEVCADLKIWKLE